MTCDSLSRILCQIFDSRTFLTKIVGIIRDNSYNYKRQAHTATLRDNSKVKCKDNSNDNSNSNSNDNNSDNNNNNKNNNSNSNSNFNHLHGTRSPRKHGLKTSATTNTKANVASNTNTAHNGNGEEEKNDDGAGSSYDNAQEKIIGEWVKNRIINTLKYSDNEKCTLVKCDHGIVVWLVYQIIWQHMMRKVQGDDLKDL